MKHIILFVLSTLLLVGCNDFAMQSKPEPVMSSPPASHEERDSERFYTKPNDKILSQLDRASLAFSLPGSTNIDERIRAQLIISMDIPVEELTEHLTIPGSEFTSEVQVSEIVMAALTSPDFIIEKVTSDRQAISETGITDWQWLLTPKKSGTAEVLVTVTAFVYVDENNFVERHIRTFQQIVTVDIKPVQMVKRWYGEHWQWAFAALFVPLCAYFRRTIRRITKRKPR